MRRLGCLLFVMAVIALSVVGCVDVEPDCSKNGCIAFVTDRDGNEEIYLTDSAGKIQFNLTKNPAYDDSEPVWSPDGKRIAYRVLLNGNYDVYIMNADGSGQTRLTTHANWDIHPVVSPDGKRVAFVRCNLQGKAPVAIPAGTTVRCQVYAVNSDGTGCVNLSNSNSDDNVPAWSPDGKQIAFLSDRDGNHEIYVMDADGGRQKNLTQHPSDDNLPAWSPDGTKIAFISDRDGSYHIFVMNADGSGQKRLFNSREMQTLPAWSPDGKQIAFTLGDPTSMITIGNLTTPTRNVAVVNADGSWFRNLTEGMYFDSILGGTVAQWSPNGKSLVLQSNAFWGNQDIWVGDVGGQTATRLTTDQAAESHPVWQPVPPKP